MRTGTATHVLVIGAEKLSQWIDWTDRSTAIIFADGAGAVIEWGDRFDATSGSDRVVISFEVVDDTTRRLEVSLEDSSLADSVLEALAT